MVEKIILESLSVLREAFKMVQSDPWPAICFFLILYLLIDKGLGFFNERRKRVQYKYTQGMVQKSTRTTESDIRAIKKAMEDIGKILDRLPGADKICLFLGEGGERKREMFYDSCRTMGDLGKLLEDKRDMVTRLDDYLKSWSERERAAKKCP